MNHETVIDWQLNQLEQGTSEAMPDDMVAYVNQNPDLADELKTLALFLQPQTPLPEPSTALKDGFYQSLNTAMQPASLDAARESKKADKHSSWQWAQAAAVIGVFVLGFAAGKFPNITNDDALTALQQEVASLNTVMAINMLQHKSASQRLVGANYTKQANIADPHLAETLLTAFANEQKTAVKLAIIDALQETERLSHIETSLLDLALNENQPIVQMALCRLLLNAASVSTQNSLLEQLNSQQVHPDVKEFLQLVSAQNLV